MRIKVIGIIVVAFIFLSALPLRTSVAEKETFSSSNGVQKRTKLGSSFSQVTKLLASNGDVNDEFGSSVAISGDTLIVVAQNRTAYIFSRNQSSISSWQEVIQLNPNEPVPFGLGATVAIAGNLAVVGAPLRSLGQGAAFIFNRNNGGSNNWGEVTELAFSDMSSSVLFGASVSISNDTVVVGSPGTVDNTIAGAAYIFNRNHGDNNNWGEVAKLTDSDTPSGSRFGGSVSISGDTVVVGAATGNGQKARSGVAYIFSRNKNGSNAWGQVAKLMVDNGRFNDNFGFSVAIAGDTVVIGAPGENFQLGEGAAYIFSRNKNGSNAWGQIKKITGRSENSGIVDFGQSVSISGNTTVVGASISIIPPDVFNGSIHIFDRSQGGSNNWGLVTELFPDDASVGFSGDKFSDSVAISGNTIVVGAPDDDDRGSDSGSAYIFGGNSTLTISSTPTSTLEGNQGGSSWGRSLSQIGDINADGYPDAIVGSPSFNNGQIGEGIARVFLGTPNGISNTSAQLLEINQTGAQFGFSVAGIGDLNNDGFDDVAVGAPSFSQGEMDEGAVFVYLGAANGLQTPAFRILQSNQIGAKMGFSVAAAGDVNADGFADLIMGMPGFTPNLQNRQAGGAGPVGGIAQLLGGLFNAISQNPDLVIAGTQAGEALGTSVAGAGDVNGDGVDDIIAGAPSRDRGAVPNAGTANVYPGSPAGVQAAPLVEFLGTLANAALGSSVVGLGDINRDGFDDVAVGAPGRSRGQNNEGTVNVYLGGVIPSPEPEFTLEGGRENARLGESLVCINDFNSDGVSELIAGAPEYSNGQTGEGAVYVFESDEGRYEDQPRILESNDPEAKFGLSAAGIGTLDTRGFMEIAVGAPLADGNQTDEGVVSIYTLRRVLQTSGVDSLLQDNFEN